MNVKVGQVYDRDIYPHKLVVSNVNKDSIRFIICCVEPNKCKSIECNPYIVNGKGSVRQKRISLKTFKFVREKEKSSYKLNIYDTFKNLKEMLIST